ncbi:MAG TPA: hypothetical protein VNY05_37540 [Candidatus Acidoferrales bacterium]|nr:hypothetical protein [Candidatus Acidoferrales bacterium]
MTDFATIKEAASRKPHGTHARYVAGGCHCRPCRAAHSRYNTERARAKKDGDWNGIVSADAARKHLLWLSRRGVGYKAVGAAADVAPSILFAVRRGTKKRIRGRTERRILAVDQTMMADTALVDASQTWVLIAPKPTARA